MSPGGRIISPILTMVPQMIAGAVITFTEYDLYPIFDLCGRAMPGMSAVTDQTIGGLTMWVLAGLVEVAGLMFALATLLRLSGKNRLPNKQDRMRARQRGVLPAS
jgi:putative membrane protein